MVLVPEAVVSTLAKKFKEDIRIPVEKNQANEKKNPYLDEIYIFYPYEEIKVLIMIHGEEASKIELLGKNGEPVSKSNS